MADELDPNAAAGTAGDPGDPGAEHGSGEQGESQPTVEELQAQLAEMGRREELLLKSVSRGGSRAAAEAPVNPPTAPDPRAEGALRDNDRRIQAERAEVARLAEGGDVTSKYLLRQAEQRVEDLERFGTAMRYLYGEMQEMKATSSIPEAERDDWSQWYATNKGDYNSVKAARLAYEGHKALEASKAPRAPANGSGVKPLAPRAPAPKQRVDISIRPMGSEETRKAVAQMRGDDFDNQLAALQASNDPGDRAKARDLQGRMMSGELDLID